MGGAKRPTVLVGEQALSCVLHTCVLLDFGIPGQGTFSFCLVEVALRFK